MEKEIEGVPQPKTASGASPKVPKGWRRLGKNEAMGKGDVFGYVEFPSLALEVVNGLAGHTPAERSCPGLTVYALRRKVREVKRRAPRG